MLRILLLCPRDWQHPRASGTEHFTYEIFSRIAGQGHYVAWLCQNYGNLPFMGARHPVLERSSGIQVARLGSRAIYRAMVGLFFSRLSRPDSALRQFDVVVDVVNGRPFPVGKYTTTQAVPIVFHLAPGLRGSPDPPGPVIAPTEQSWLEIANAGIPKGHIIRAPFGLPEVDPESLAFSDGPPALAAVIEHAQPLMRALRVLQRSGAALETAVLGGNPIRRGSLPVRHHPGADLESRQQAMRRAWFAYCGEGREWQALEFMAHGLPVIVPDTAAGREFVNDGHTGLVHRARDAFHLAQQMERLINDEVLRQRLGREGRESTRSRSWERSAGLVLATIENLCFTGPEPLVSV